MNKEEMIEILHRVLKTEAELDFLIKMDESELETLVACIRARVDKTNYL